MATIKDTTTDWTWIHDVRQGHWSIHTPDGRPVALALTKEAAEAIIHYRNCHDELVAALEGLHEAIALGPLEAASMYGPDFDVDANLQDKAIQARAILAKATKGE